MVAAFFGRHANIQAWVDYFEGSWDLDRRDKIIGGTYLSLAALASDAADAGRTLEVLLDAGANAHFRVDTGSGLLTVAALSLAANPSRVSQAISARLDVNHQNTSQTIKWRMILSLARLAARHGTTKAVLLEMSTWDGSTALICAAREGKVAEVRVLLAAAADPSLRNRQGLTALDLTRSRFGGVVPPLLQQLLTGQGLAVD